MAKQAAKPDEPAKPAETPADPGTFWAFLWRVFQSNRVVSIALLGVLGIDLAYGWGRWKGVDALTWIGFTASGTVSPPPPPPPDPGQVFADQGTEAWRIGGLYRRAGRFADFESNLGSSLLSYGKAMGQSPNPSFKVSAAQVLNELGRYEKAAQILREMFTMSEFEAIPRNKRGWHYNEMACALGRQLDMSYEELMAAAGSRALTQQEQEFKKYADLCIEAERHFQVELPLRLDGLKAIEQQRKAAASGQLASHIPIPPLRQPKEGLTGVLVDLAHGQKDWRVNSPFQFLTSSKRSALPNSAMIDVEAVSSPGQYTAKALSPWRGMVLGMPYHIRLNPATIQEIALWVRGGGRLLLLGFELGDRHHGTNLNALCSEFGLGFNTDILAPGSWKGDAKPYGQPISFKTNVGSHPILAGLAEFTLLNVQSIRTEPGSSKILELGDNLLGMLSVPAGDILYDEGVLKIPKGQAFQFQSQRELPVIAQAHKQLTGKGEVLAIGTWDFPGLDQETQDPATLKLLGNLLQWLSAK